MQLTTFCWKQLRITLLRVYAMYFIRIYLSGTQQYNTDILFPIKEPFRAEQLTKNLIQWLWIDYIDWKMTTFYETRHHLTCVVLSHSTAGGGIYCLFSICCVRMKYKMIDWFGFWCLTPPSAIFQLYHGDQF
jgi:hypothetical protein